MVLYYLCAYYPPAGGCNLFLLVHPAAKPLGLSSQLSNPNSCHDYHPLRLQKEGIKMDRRVTDSRRPKSMDRQAMTLLKSGRPA